MDRPRIVILGAGVGGTLTANLLAKALPAGAADVTLVDATGLHTYQPGWLYVALDRANAGWLARDVRSLLRDEIDLVIDRAVEIDHAGNRVMLERGGELGYDHLVIATGSHLDEAAVPGFREGANHFYSTAAAERLREALRRFDGGDLVIGVAGLPYKCPVAPLEFAFMVEEQLRKRGLRDRTNIRYLSPINRAFTIETVSTMVEPMLAERGIEVSTFANVETVDPVERRIDTLEGESFHYDLAVLIPQHVGAEVVRKTGLADVQGWLKVDRHTLRVQGTENVYAIGDATDLPISKAGSTAHFEAPVVVEQIVAAITRRAPDEVRSRYGGRVMCFLEVGGGKATMLRFDYDNPPRPPKPSRFWHLAKWGFNRAYWFTLPQGRL